MAVQIEIREDSVLACLSGEIDHHSAVELREQIDQSVIQSGAKTAGARIFHWSPLWTPRESGW